MGGNVSLATVAAAGSPGWAVSLHGKETKCEASDSCDLMSSLSVDSETMESFFSRTMEQMKLNVLSDMILKRPSL